MTENRSASMDVLLVTLKVLCIGILLVSTFWVMRPFLIPLVWAALIVIATWPALLRLEVLMGGRRGLAVTIMTLLILLVVLVPLTLAVLSIINNAEDFTTQLRTLVLSIPLSPPAWIENIPLAGDKIAAQWRDFGALSPEERAAYIAPYAKTVIMWFIAKAGSMGSTLLQFLLTAIITAILYVNAETVRSGIVSFMRRLAGQRGEDVAILAGKSIRGVALGVVLTALIQTAIGGLGLFVTGVPAASILTAIMFMLCIAQLGPILILVPAVIWMYWKVGALWGTVLLAFTLPACILDNIIRPILIKKGADLPLLLIFAGVIGGLVAFGVIGLFIGPVVLAVTYTLLKVWVAGDGAGEGVSQEGTGVNQDA